jgi:cytoskeletal protein RodZ
MSYVTAIVVGIVFVIAVLIFAALLQSFCYQGQEDSPDGDNDDGD